MSTKLSRYCDGIMEAAWIAAIVVIPLFFNIYSSRIFEPDKITILRTLSLLILATWLVKLVEEKGIRWDKIEYQGSILKTISGIPMIFPVLILGIIYIIATIFSVNPRISLGGSYQRLQGTYTYFSYLVLFASIVGNLRKRSQVERLITIVILTSLPIGLYGILQNAGRDPVPWGGNVANRIASNMGNSIFVAAYLIMTVPLTIGRIIDSFDKIWTEDERLGSNILRATIYVFIGAVEIIAIYMSGSRGPLLGLLAGLFFMFLLLSVYWRKRWLTILSIGAAAVMGVFLVLLNVPNGPLEFVRQAPGVGRFGHVLDMDQRTSQVRILIWQGASELVLPHDPLVFPDGSTDKLNFLRPIIGYGPESMYVAYNQFYPPELGRVEKRNASPDRSHNETWDALVTTGISGLLIYLLLFGSIFYYGLKWVGLIRNEKHRYLFITFLVLGGLAGGIGLSIWQGIGFIGVGIPFGVLLGLIAYLAMIALISSEVYILDEFNRSHVLVLIMLIGAIVAHFAEINFGIAIVATRTHFWIYSGLLLVVGYILPLYGEVESIQEAISEESTLDEENESKRRRSKKSRKDRRRSLPPIVGRQPAWRRNAIIGALIISLLLVTLGYDFISNPNSAQSVSKIIVSSFTRLPNKDDAVSFGVMALIITTWISSMVVITSEQEESNSGTTWIKTFLTMLGISLVIILLYWLWHASTLAALSSFKATNQNEVLNQIDRIGGLLNRYYIYLFLILFLLGLFLPTVWTSRTVVTTLGSFAAPIMLLLVIYGMYITNVRMIQADIAFKMAEPFANSNQWPVATFIYRDRALELTPNEDHYYLFLGKSYLEEAKNVETELDQDNLVQQAETDLKVAQKINPLNTDHTANLGRLYSWWAGRADNADIRNDRVETASNYYSIAVQLSPNNPNLWNEWAILNMDVRRDMDEAFDLLSHSLELDDQYSWTHSLLGDYYLRLARASNNESEKLDLYHKAIDHYEKAVNSTTNREKDAKVSYLVSLGNGYIELANNFPDDKNEYIRSASEAYLIAIESDPRKNDLWKIEETLSRLYAQLGDKAGALLHANAAFSAAPNNQKEKLQNLISQIQNLP